MELWNLHIFPILRFSVLRYRERLNFLLQHRNDDALDSNHLGFTLRLARGVLAVFGALGFDKTRRSGTFEGEKIAMKLNWKY